MLICINVNRYLQNRRKSTAFLGYVQIFLQKNDDKKYESGTFFVSLLAACVAGLST